MISEDKVKLMTSIAIMEKQEGKRSFSVNRFFRSDYVSRHLIRAFVIYTLAMCLCLLLWLICNLEVFVNSLDADGLVGLAQQMGWYYFLGLAVYLFIGYWVYDRRYEYAAGKMKMYVAKLRKLDKRYEFQDKTKMLAREGHKL